MCCQDSLMPLFTFPSNGGAVPPWNQIIGTQLVNGVYQYNSPLPQGLNRWIIVSPFVDAGSAQDLNWVDVIENVHTGSLTPGGTKALCYMDLSFGANSESLVKTKIDNASNFYFGFQSQYLFFDGIFFDQTAGQADLFKGTGNYIQYLEDILFHATNASNFGPDLMYWFNTGFYPDETLMNLDPGVNTGFTLENTYAAWLEFDIPGAPQWLHNYSGRRINSLVHDCSEAQMVTGAALANTINSGSVYFSDGTGNNPYTQLPTYRQQEIPIITGKCPCGTPGGMPC
jgi:hypothetical protein